MLTVDKTGRGKDVAGKSNAVKTALACAVAISLLQTVTAEAAIITAVPGQIVGDTMSAAAAQQKMLAALPQGVKPFIPERWPPSTLRADAAALAGQREYSSSSSSWRKWRSPAFSRSLLSGYSS